MIIHSKSIHQNHFVISELTKIIIRYCKKLRLKIALYVHKVLVSDQWYICHTICIYHYCDKNNEI